MRVVVVPEAEAVWYSQEGNIAAWTLLDAVTKSPLQLLVHAGITLENC